MGEQSEVAWHKAVWGLNQRHYITAIWIDES
jgi:hypothetical protein